MSDGYVYIKISMKGNRKSRYWKAKHRWVWEQANGEIPEGIDIIFLDGDRHNIILENLAAVTKAEEIKLVQYGLISNNREFTLAGIALVKHQLAIHDRLEKTLGTNGHHLFINKISRKRVWNRKKLSLRLQPSNSAPDYNPATEPPKRKTKRKRQESKGGGGSMRGAVKMPKVPEARCGRLNNKKPPAPRLPGLKTGAVTRGLIAGAAAGSIKRGPPEKPVTGAGRGGKHYGKVSAMGQMADSAVKAARQKKKGHTPYKPTPQMHTLLGIEDMRMGGI
jgi:hypothetical protein